MVEAAPFTDPVTYHGEGAVWSPTWGGLRCVDMFAGDVLDITLEGAVTRRHVGTTACMIRPIDAHRSVIALERDVVVMHEATGQLEPLATGLAPEDVRLNEGGCTPGGELLIGSVAWDGRTGGGSLLRMNRRGEHEVVLDRATVSNGVGFSPDASTMYYNDSATGSVDAFDVDDRGVLTNRRSLATIAVGGPDGLWVDSEGGIWVAIFGGSAVHRYRPDGVLDAVVRVGARQVTSCTFGGDDLSTLFITTSRENLSDDDDPLAGSLFRVDVGVRGLAVLPYIPAANP